MMNVGTFEFVHPGRGSLWSAERKLVLCVRLMSLQAIHHPQNPRVCDTSMTPTKRQIDHCSLKSVSGVSAHEVCWNVVGERISEFGVLVYLWVTQLI